jgi:hypothetical protein
VTYQYFNPSTQSYETYEPTPVKWTDFYESPSVSLFTHDEVQCTYTEESNPSPFGSYSFYNEPTNEYVTYIPTSPVWTNYYEPTTEPLYSYNEYTGGYDVETTPSPY